MLIGRISILNKFLSLLPTIGFSLFITIILVFSLLVYCLYKDESPDTSPMTYYTSCLSSPFIEEILFRLPLILLFDSLNSTAIVVSILVSLFFGYLHKDNYEIRAKTYGTPIPNKTIRIYSVIIITLLSCILSVFAIQYQSLWIPILIHLAWNIFHIVSAFFIVLRKYYARNH